MKQNKNIKFLDLKEKILREIIKRGGWVNAHCHLDRAFTLSPNNFHFTSSTLQEKWHLVDELKRNSSVANIYDRMAFALENMLKQKVQAVGSFIDIDEVVKDKAIKAAQKLRSRYSKQIKIKFINQVLKGVIKRQARYWFDLASQFVDIIGGLPGKDKEKEEEHLDIIFDTASKLKKMVHIHVDQCNTQKEKETELLVKKIIQHDMSSKATAIHCVSLSTHPISYRKKIYQKIKKTKTMVVSCPSAWIDSRRTEELTPTHNAIAPVEELCASGIIVGLGTDNIIDIYKPFSDGDMWTELRFLLESCHFYEIDQLVKIATDNGLKILGIKN